MLILFSIDGLRPDALLQADAPTITRLMQTGIYSMSVTTVMPSCTLPCHTSMVRGVATERHGVTTNTFRPLVRPVPSIFDVATQAGLNCGFYMNWGELRDLGEPGSTTISVSIHDNYSLAGDDRVAEEAIRSLNRDKIDLAFVYLGHTDSAGHDHGWMSAPYFTAIANADRCIARILEAVPGATCLVTSDHGGHDRHHGSDMPEDMTIPLVIAGPGIEPKGAINQPIYIYDVAPTLAKLLGLSLPREWDGHSIL